MEMETMPNDPLITTKLKLVRKSKLPDVTIEASIQKGKIYIKGKHLLIEKGDLIKRKLINGSTETYKIIFHKFYNSNEIPFQHELKVEKLNI